VKGADLYRKGDLNQSLDMLNKSLSSDPYSVRAWMTKGDALSAMGRYIEAAAAYSQVLHLDPSDGAAAGKRGDAFMNAGQYADAIASYDRAIAMDPGLPGIRSNRSLAKQLASGMVRANISVTGPLNTPESTISPALPGVNATGTAADMATLPSPAVPGTKKAALSLTVLPAAIIIAGVMTIIFRRR
jgi:tetratricopeptide (TPR) repeat protein